MNIMVIFGGESVEHEVSIITAYQLIERLNRHTVYPIYITKDSDMLYVKKSTISDFKGSDYLKKSVKAQFTKKGFNKKKMDVAIIAMHGTNGEDGMMASLLNFYDIPFVGSNSISAGIGQDKGFMKDILSKNDIPVIPYQILYDYEFISNEYKVKLPCIIKPARLGSSIGIKVAFNDEELHEYLKETFLYDKKVIIEDYLPNLRELNCAFVGDYEYQNESNIEEILKKKPLLDYDDKYLLKNSGRIIKAVVDKNLEKRIVELGKKTMRLFDCSGVCRIDYLVDGDNVYVNEINTIPGSFSFYLFDEDFPLLEQLLKIAFKDYYNRKKKVYSFNNNILDSSGIKIK